jgi:sulfite exporter TauE/SafE
MNHTLTIGAALLLGLVASGHCLVMCGGITAALGVATARGVNGRPQLPLLVCYQLGRIASYSLAGLLFAGVFGGLIALLDVEWIRRTLRGLSALALVIAALVAFGRARDLSLSIGQGLWRRLAPLGRRLLPITSASRALAFGMVWGWMPCGFVYGVLLIATLQPSAAQGALTMAAFGCGTAPALLAAGFGANRFAGWAAHPVIPRAAGTALLISAVVTLCGPWLMQVAPGLHH